MQSEIVEIEDLVTTESTTKPKPEYAKILIKERNRKLNNRALDLIKLGCFEQKETSKIEFSRLEKVTYEKQFKKLYDLYLDEKGNLIYICPKTEGESNIPYAYDCLYLETMTDDEFDEIRGVAKYKKAFIIKYCYIISLVILIISAFLILVNYIYSFAVGSSFLDVIINSVSYLMSLGVLFGITAIACAQYHRYIGR